MYRGKENKMPTAKSYQSLEILGEPYELNGKMYVKVQAKSGVKSSERPY